jgi:SAM-dependent methyltransferase
MRDHWEDVYGRNDPRAVSWYEPAPERSLAWIERSGAARDAAILDAGGGASSLAAELVARGFEDVTVADISAAALERSRSAAGAAGDRIRWIRADLRDHDLGRRYDVWHDRAVLHFMVDARDRDRYVDTIRASLRPGGHLVLATFGPDGPERCSGLPVRRYAASDAEALLGDDFELVAAEDADHTTPGGSTQRFLYALLRRRAAA